MFGQCTDPTNPDCIHLPLTLYEPPRKSGWKNRAKGLIGRAKSSGVRPFSGEFQIVEADLVIPGRGLDFTWTRTYRSRTGSNTAMGNGWDFSYNIYLIKAVAAISSFMMVPVEKTPIPTFSLEGVKGGF